MFGFLFEDIKPRQKPTITEMSEKEFYQELEVDKKVAAKSLFKANKIREMFKTKLTPF